VSRFRLTDQAKADLKSIWAYVTQDSYRSADRLVARIATLFPKLADHPRMGRSREDLLPGLRSFPVLRYVIFYQATADGVEILRILPGSRDIQSTFQVPQGQAPPPADT